MNSAICAFEAAEGARMACFGETRGARVRLGPLCTCFTRSLQVFVSQPHSGSVDGFVTCV